MTLEEFRRNDSLVSEWRNVLNMPIWQVVAEVMLAQHPMRTMNVAPGFSESDDSKALGIIRGWNMYGDALAMMGVPSEKQAPLESTFEPPEEPKKRKRR